MRFLVTENNLFLANSTDHFRRLIAFRWIAILIELLFFILANAYLKLSIAPLPVGLLIAAHAVLNILATLSLRQVYMTKETRLFVFLVGDTVLLGGLLYFSGGSTNPFVSLLLLPLIIVASILHDRYVLTIAMLTTAVYTLLMVYRVPLRFTRDEGMAFDLHVTGMWFGFLLAMLLIVFFVSRMASSLRRSEKQLAKIREQSLRDEHIVAIGTLAAAAAHELGTPLSTISVIANELEHDFSDNVGIKQKMTLLLQELGRCKRIISDISAQHNDYRAEEGGVRRLDSYIRGMLAQWQSSRKNTGLRSRQTLSGSQPPPHIFIDKRLTQCILNLLNNAADASQEVSVQAHWDREALSLQIRDNGPGIPAALLEKIGTPFFSTKTNGYGLGLFLAYSIIERYNGQLTVINHPDGGAVASVTLPLSKLICDH